MKLIRPGRHTQWFILALGPAIAVGLTSLSAFPTPSSAQNTATATTTTASAATARGLNCTGAAVPTPDPLKGQMDPFLGPLVGPSLPAGLLPISDATRKSIFGAGLPCQEKVSPSGQETVAPDNLQPAGLDNLQRGFDFYSWRTFIALNSPADGSPIEQAQAGAPTLWEDMNSFKQLLDVMLTASQLSAKWLTDKKEMVAERERLMPTECRDLHVRDESERMIVKMIEESFNEPFKTGP